MAELAVAADEAGLDVFAIGEHHNPPFVTSAQTTLMAFMRLRPDSDPRQITRPSILGGAMTDDDAARPCDLMTGCVSERVDTAHGFHFEKPADFAALLRQLYDRATP